MYHILLNKTQTQHEVLFITGFLVQRQNDQYNLLSLMKKNGPVCRQDLLQSYDQVVAMMQQHCRKVAAVCFYHADEVCHKVAADLLQNCGKHLAVLWEKGLTKLKICMRRPSGMLLF